MKIFKIITMAILTIGLSHTAYADHHGKDGMHGDRSHDMENADTNKDGAISHEEFTAAHHKMAETMFSKMDTNKDGKIDKAERDAMKAKMGDHCNMKDHKMNDAAK